MRTFYPLYKPVKTTNVASTGDSQVNKSTVSYGRVVDIILDETHKRYKEKGGARAINGVFYDPIGSTTPNSQDQVTTFAYQNSRILQTVPQIGEIVSLESKPSTAIGIFGPTEDIYYTGIVNIWNHPKNNQYLNVTKSDSINDKLQSELDDSYIANPVRSYQGDVHYLGRQGQSIRLTNRLATDQTITQLPALVIRTGALPLEIPYKSVSEDINKDYSSIYLVADHKVPLKTIRPFDTVYKDAPVQAADLYKGEQILVNTGRVVVNAKVDSILLSANKAISLTSLTAHIQAKDYIAVDSKLIFLGKEALTAQRPEPVLKGNQTVSVLSDILNTLTSIVRSLSRAATVDGKPIPELNLAGSKAVPTLGAIQRQLESLKSTKTFVS